MHPTLLAFSLLFPLPPPPISLRLPFFSLHPFPSLPPLPPPSLPPLPHALRPSLRGSQLSRNALDAPLVGELSALFNLQKLDLSGNRIPGALPTGLSALTALEILSLTSNQLSDSFPAGLSALTALKKLTLFNNSLYGSLPTTLWNPTKLTFVEVSSNYLNGSLPQPPAGRSAQFSLSTNCLDQVPSQRPTDQCSRFYSSLPALIQSAAEKSNPKGAVAPTSLPPTSAAFAAAATLLASLSLALLH
ncbi:unnamed protein product [Closterium sp. NIES-54]